jgi:anti-sigma B factor antagonist
MDVCEIAVDRTPSGVAVVVLRGAHDFSTAGDLRRRLLVELERARAVVLDLEAAAFIDSTVLGAIIGGLRAARERGKAFALALDEDTSPDVGMLFRLTGLRLIFCVHPTRDQAVAAVEAAVASEA